VTENIAMLPAKKSETIRTLESHVSIRSFNSTPVSEETLAMVLNAARRAPTSSNLQAYSVVVVRDPETRRRLSILAGNQRHVAEAPVFLAFCADISRIRLACQLHSKELAGDTLEMGLVAVIDAALVGMNVASAAESLGMGTVMIGGMRNHPLEVAATLALPEGAFVIFGMCIGWPERRPPQKPRLPEAAVIHYERYNSDGVEQALDEYDRQLESHFRGIDKPTDKASWTRRVATEFSRVRRGELRAAVRRLGFAFD
jgi:nitroreductase